MELNEKSTGIKITRVSISSVITGLTYELLSYLLTSPQLIHYIPWTLPVLSLLIDKLLKHLIKLYRYKIIENKLNELKKNVHSAINDPNMIDTDIKNIQSQYSKLTTDKILKETSHIEKMIASNYDDEANSSKY